jgi:hypothetical protein
MSRTKREKVLFFLSWLNKRDTTATNSILHKLGHFCTHNLQQKINKLPNWIPVCFLTPTIRDQRHMAQEQREKRI